MPRPAASHAIVDNPEKHRFEADLGDGSIAIAEYNLLHGRITFTHTEVPSAHEGQGIGSSLIRFALASARQRGLRVIPICPFFAAYIKKHAEEQDLLDPACRKVLGLE
ncbi:MAG TPA: GNAT family N-acetyltransferase [Sphingomicrobium sp.]